MVFPHCLLYCLTLPVILVGLAPQNVFFELFQSAFCCSLTPKFTPKFTPSLFTFDVTFNRPRAGAHRMVKIIANVDLRSTSIKGQHVASDESSTLRLSIKYSNIITDLPSLPIKRKNVGFFGAFPIYFEILPLFPNFTGHRKYNT